MSQFDALEAAARTQLGRIQQLSTDLDAIQVEHSDDDATVTVSVDGAARLVDLHLSEGISRMSPAEFERAVVHTAAAAARNALARRGTLIEEFNG
ncbi:YbaB/EbfC family DNA-binding protein [Nocardia sp. SYP-A9097]|uniref:YbaB/EbfC family nucleoid-associated protein n=1 Tax=Nocardia sp. SYP-A9097 TaxID=2663237 RepID=UPI0013208082|nr:YbaB/EbfC family nucleoid-associated protein [Nocardia sp. SYP-A9097]MRH89374.1 YbaB/EbfC family DNA-binding protein [Nocardia sp. SYP-A9097]